MSSGYYFSDTNVLGPRQKTTEALPISYNSRSMLFLESCFLVLIESVISI